MVDILRIFLKGVVLRRKLRLAMHHYIGKRTDEPGIFRLAMTKAYSSPSQACAQERKRSLLRPYRRQRSAAVRSPDASETAGLGGMTRTGQSAKIVDASLQLIAIGTILVFGYVKELIGRLARNVTSI